MYPNRPASGLSLLLLVLLAAAAGLPRAAPQLWRQAGSNRPRPGPPAAQPAPAIGLLRATGFSLPADQFPGTRL